MTSSATRSCQIDPELNVSTEGHVWERWERIWTLAFYGVLTLCFGLAVSDIWNGANVGAVAGGWPGILTLAGVCLAFGLWYHLIVGRLTQSIALARGITYMVGAVAAFVLLTWLHPSFMFLPFVLFVQLFSFVPIRLAAAGAAPLTLIVWWRGAVTDGGSLEINATTVMIMLATFGVTLAVGFFIESIIRQSAERQGLIEELRAAQEGLAQAERRAGTEAERQRLAAEIHDTLAQGFTSIVLHLEAADAAIGAGSARSADVPPSIVHHLDQARQTARDSLAEARRLVWALRPEPLELATLPGALRRVAARWKEATGIATEFTVTGDLPPLPPEVEVTLLRVTQESLANIRKHARATRVAVTLSFGEGTVMLDVRDNGIGVDGNRLEKGGSDLGGFGMIGMRERVEALRGSFVLESDPGQGTTVAVALPLRPESAGSPVSPNAGAGKINDGDRS